VAAADLGAASGAKAAAGSAGAGGVVVSETVLKVFGRVAEVGRDIFTGPLSFRLTVRVFGDPERGAAKAGAALFPASSAGGIMDAISAAI